MGTLVCLACLLLIPPANGRELNLPDSDQDPKHHRLPFSLHSPIPGLEPEPVLNLTSVSTVGYSACHITDKHSGLKYSSFECRAAAWFRMPLKRWGGKS
jgi:hypothetical protein